MTGSGHNAEPSQASDPADLSFLRGDPATRVSLPPRGEYPGGETPTFDYGDETGMDLNMRWQRRKVQRNIYVAQLLTDAWPHIDAYREELVEAGSDLGLQDYDTFRESGPLTAEMMRTADNPALNLGWAMLHTMSRGLRSWYLGQRSRQAVLTDAERTPTDTAYVNLSAMLEEFTQGDYRGQQDVLSFTGNGIDTAVTAIWGVMDVVPRVFANQFSDTRLTAQQLRAIIRNSYPLVTHLAAGNQELAGAALEELQTPSQRQVLQPLMESEFVLTGEGDQMTLHITQAALNRIHGVDGKPITQTTPESSTTGCPALAARTPNGKNLVLAMWEWSMNVADRAYFPRFDAGM